MLRRLTMGDVPAALGLSDAAGWNQTAADWQRLLLLEPDGCFGIEVDGQLVATSTLLTYGTELAWLGMVLTHPNHRRRGYAHQLVEKALGYADTRGVACVKLDASEQGQPVYEQLGFVAECAVERWWRPAGQAQAAALTAAGEFPLDRQAFGADRSRLLSTLRPFVQKERAYAASRPGRLAAYFGPCVSPDPKPVPEFVAWAQQEHAGTAMFWDLFADHTQATALAADLGFVWQRRLMRMSRGRHTLTGNPSQIYALAGFEVG